MNYLQSVYAYLQHARLKEGYPSGSSPNSGNLVLACCLTMLMFSIVLTLYLLFSGVADWTDDLLKDLFGRRSGKTISRVIGILLILLIFPIIKFTVGTPENFNKTISAFEAMSDNEKERTAKKGRWFFILSLSSIAIPFIIGVFR